MGVGDEILAAGQAQRWFDATAEPSAILDKRGTPRWHPIWDGNPAIVRPEAYRPGQHTIINGPNCRPYIVYPFTAESGWTFDRTFRCRDHVAKIYLTEEESAAGRDLRAELGPYILIEPWSKHANLRWPGAQWAALVAHRSDIPFVQHVHSQTDYVVPGVRRAVRADFRHACGLVASAAVYVRGESGMVHAAAALGTQQITIWGGCMDWEVMGGYAGQIGVGISPDPPCGSYLPCLHCARIMAKISVDDVLGPLDRQWQKALADQHNLR